MNILFVHFLPIAPFYGGVERVTLLLSLELKKRGHNIEFLSLTSQNSDIAYNTQNTFVQHYLPIDELSPEEFGKELHKIHHDFNTELIIVQGTNQEERNFVKHSPQNIKAVTVLHNQPYPILGKERKVKGLTPLGYLQIKGKFLTLLGRFAPRIFRKLYLANMNKIYEDFLYSSENFILLSEKFRDRFIKHSPDSWAEKTIAINNPITFSIEESKTDDSQKENIVLVVARLSNPQKNITGFIDVWKIFQEQHPDWKAIVIGSGEHENYIRQYVAKRKVENISFIGPRNDVQDFYRRSKIFCMTSSYEGWPMVLMETMAFGCVPVVYDTFEAVHDILAPVEIEGEMLSPGIIVSPFKKDLMAEAMGELATDELLLGTMAEAGRRRINDYTVEKIVDQWEMLFDRI